MNCHNNLIFRIILISNRCYRSRLLLLLLFCCFIFFLLLLFFCLVFLVLFFLFSVFCCLFVLFLSLFNYALDSRNPGPDVTWGWDIRSDRSNRNDGNNEVFTLRGEPIPHDGIVTQWRYWSTSTKPFKGIICRYIPGEDCEVVGINEIPGAPKDQDIIYIVPVEERIHVKQGYEMGFASPVFCSDRSPSKKPGLPYVRYSSYPVSNLWKGTRVPMPHWKYAWYYSAYSIQITIESGKFCYRIEKK